MLVLFLFPDLFLAAWCFPCFPKWPLRGLLCRWEVQASLCSDVSCCRAQALECGLGNCGPRAWLPPRCVQSCRTGDLTQTPALAGRFLTPEPPGKSLWGLLDSRFFRSWNGQGKKVFNVPWTVSGWVNILQWALPTFCFRNCFLSLHQDSRQEYLDNPKGIRLTLHPWYLIFLPRDRVTSFCRPEFPGTFAPTTDWIYPRFVRQL